ncbi:MAG: hypothetical protein NTY53_08580 [Kiritimatiellaeota bacterium]|nr:hypothetical protein [Kiritimatiellota bacterium]
MYGLFLGFSIVWLILSFWGLRPEEKWSTDHTAFWPIEGGVFIVSILCGFPFAVRSSKAERDPETKLTPNTWIFRPWKAFLMGLCLSLSLPGILMAVFWTLYHLIMP